MKASEFQRRHFSNKLKVIAKRSSGSVRSFFPPFLLKERVSPKGESITQNKTKIKKTLDSGSEAGMTVGGIKNKFQLKERVSPKGESIILNTY